MWHLDFIKDMQLTRKHTEISDFCLRTSNYYVNYLSPFCIYLLNNNIIYLLQLSCHPVAVVILHVYKYEIGY